jgi:hypothetical protein
VAAAMQQLALASKRKPSRWLYQAHQTISAWPSLALALIGGICKHGAKRRGAMARRSESGGEGAKEIWRLSEMQCWRRTCQYRLKESRKYQREKACLQLMQRIYL